MSRPRFLADHNLNDHIVVGTLRRESAIEFRRECGLADLSNAELLTYAASEGLVVVSHDVNTLVNEAYLRLDRDSGMAGLLLVKQTDPVAPVIESQLLIWCSSEAEEWVGAVGYLPL